MSKISKLFQNGTDIQWWKSSAVPYLIHDLPLNIYGELYWKLRGVEFTPIYEYDWDNLIILDACRYDVFEEEYSGTGKLQLRYSKAPTSASFFHKHFKGEKLHDLVSITANPHHKTILEDNQFHSVYHLWETHWNKEIKNVHPADVKDVTLEANKSHPQKRLMIHFMQPHAPFIGPWAQENIGIHVGNKHSRRMAIRGDYDIDTTSPYSLAADGKLSDSELERGYRENLNIALEHVEDLISQLDGKTVITADHGELLGERALPYPWKEYQHPPILAEKLLQVPWLVIDSGERKRIKTEVPNISTDGTNSDIDKRLKQLGYK